MVDLWAVALAESFAVALASPLAEVKDSSELDVPADSSAVGLALVQVIEAVD